MDKTDSIPALRAMLYEAAGEPERWFAFLKRLEQVFESPVNVLFPQDLRTDASNADASTAFHMDLRFMQSYAEHYAAKNPFLKFPEITGDSGRIFRSQGYVSTPELQGSEFYNEWMKPQRVWHGLHGIVHKEGSSAVVLGLIRYRDMPLFDESEERLINRLVPHLRRSIQLHRKIAALQMNHQAAASLLDRWPMGVILLGEKGNVLLMNAIAEQITGQRDGLLYERGVLRASHRSESELLRKRIATAIAASRAEDVPPGGAVTLSRPSLKPSWKLLITPIRTTRALFLETRPSAVVFIGQPDRSAPNTDFLRDAYRLTPAEADVAALLMKGRSLKEGAEELQISMATIRTHLSRLLSKTGARRQAELVQLLLSGPANLRKPF